MWHPTQKPVALARYLIRTYSNEGDTVLDNAFGSGSIPLSALLENRNCIGIEKNENILKFKDSNMDLIKIARERIEEHFGKGKCETIHKLSSVNKFCPIDWTKRA